MGVVRLVSPLHVVQGALSWATQLPLDPFVLSSVLAITSMPLLSGGTLIGGGGHHVLIINQRSALGPESFTSAALPDFVEATPFSVNMRPAGSLSSLYRVSRD